MKKNLLHLLLVGSVLAAPQPVSADDVLATAAIGKRSASQLEGVLYYYNFYVTAVLQFFGATGAVYRPSVVDTQAVSASFADLNTRIVNASQEGLLWENARHNVSPALWKSMVRWPLVFHTAMPLKTSQYFRLAPWENPETLNVDVFVREATAEMERLEAALVYLASLSDTKDLYLLHESGDLGTYGVRLTTLLSALATVKEQLPSSSDAMTGLINRVQAVAEGLGGLRGGWLKEQNYAELLQVWLAISLAQSQSATEFFEQVKTAVSNLQKPTCRGLMTAIKVGDIAAQLSELAYDVLYTGGQIFIRDGQLRHRLHIALTCGDNQNIYALPVGEELRWQSFIPITLQDAFTPIKVGDYLMVLNVGAQNVRVVFGGLNTVTLRTLEYNAWVFLADPTIVTFYDERGSSFIQLQYSSSPDTDPNYYWGDD